MHSYTVKTPDPRGEWIVEAVSHQLTTSKEMLLTITFTLADTFRPRRNSWHRQEEALEAPKALVVSDTTWLDRSDPRAYIKIVHKLVQETYAVAMSFEGAHIGLDDDCCS